MSTTSSSAPVTLPPYLTSGASSRAHHALLVRLNKAGSTQEEDEIISKEVKRAREVLSLRGQSMGKIADTLIVLLHCSMLRHRTDDDLEFALLYALQLAEGGRTIGERRIGYLYLVERLRPGHELGLLLINTLRKDLSSSTPSHILLALHTIVKLPSMDLAPAVTPLLTSKVLLKHKLAAVRQRTLEAIFSLYCSATGHELSPCPLSMSKIVRLVEKEIETPVIAVLYRIMRFLIESGSHRVETEEEADYIAEVILQSRMDTQEPGQVDNEALRTFGAILRGGIPPSSSVFGHVSEWLIGRLRGINPNRALGGAFLLETCSLIGTLPNATDHCLAQISHLILRDTSQSSSTGPPPLPKPNDHVLALKCLMNLPRRVWDGKLGEREMSVIMEGVNSADDAIRRTTIRLLDTLSAELPAMVFQRYLGSLRESSDLSLPLLTATDLTIEEKTTLGRNETASRAQEVLDVQSGEDGAQYAQGIVQLLGVLDAQERTTWQEGIKLIVDRVRAGTKRFGGDFAAALGRGLSTQPSSSGNTAVAILCTVICEYLPTPPPDLQDIISHLCDKLPEVDAGVQEVILISLVRLSDASPDTARQRILDTVQALASRSGTSRYLQKRCAEVVTVIEHGLLVRMEFRAAETLPDLSSAISSIAAEYHHKVKSNEREARSRSSSRSVQDGEASHHAGSRSAITASQLRYDAYDPPAIPANVKTPRLGRSVYRDREGHESDSG
ncbi:hypothetical protein IAT40_005157 [Kwoniella sp. CBS 6097]